MLVPLDEGGMTFPSEFPRFANLLANFFFVLTVYLKARCAGSSLCQYQLPQKA